MLGHHALITPRQRRRIERLHLADHAGREQHVRHLQLGAGRRANERQTETAARTIRLTLTALALVSALLIMAGGGLWWAVLPALGGALWCIWQR